MLVLDSRWWHQRLTCLRPWKHDILTGFIVLLQVQGLAGILDIDLQPLRQHSDTVTALCDKLREKIGL